MPSARFPGLPDELWQFGEIFCAEFRGWTTLQPSAQWIELVESIAGAIGVNPAFGHAAALNFSPRLIGPKSIGSWKRIRKRVLGFISNPATYHELCVLSRDGFQIGKVIDEGFIELRRNIEPGIRESQLAIAVAGEHASSPRDLLEKITPAISQILDAKWGAVYSFPMAAGGDFYMRGAAFTGPEILSLGSLADTDKLYERTYRARRSFNFPFSAGYVRELYEINFLSREHLLAPLNGSTVKQYTEKVGRLTTSSIIADTFEWTLARDELQRAREDWEKSGLVLAADREPLRLRARH